MAWLKSALHGTSSRVTAAILGSLLTTIALTVGITLWWPFGDRIEQVFAGGVFFFVFWAGLFYWALLSKNGGQAWLKMMCIFVPMIGLDILGLGL